MFFKAKEKEKRKVHLIAHYKPRSPITEQYRQIGNNIYFSAVDCKIQTIVVTSPEPSDGKSTTAANLAIVLAQQGNSVLLVDTDLRKPTVHYTFDLSNLNGLTNVLTKKINLDQAIYQAVIPSLDILTSGPIPPNPSELLNSNAMKFIIDSLKEGYDYVVFDTPPLLAVTDSQILANKCDGVVMVISSGKTQKVVAEKARDLLIKAKARMLGVVVNSVEHPDTSYYYQ